MAKKLLAGALAAASAAAGAALHLAWYVRYQVDGRPREHRSGPRGA